ncbi:alcohol dehydrogenase [Neptunomonas marina]|uniref:Alcohol dehydrogenase n=2 Tax=Neptunomonas marina TaxID=1815562 RepID=A0A437Q9E3_9GAMM|nr:alcohol dehydrogenase [Neptunomonas marina]
MSGVVLTGHGGLDQLEYRHDLPVPEPKAGEVLIKVGASAINNTDINTRIGWYSKAVQSGTDTGATQGFSDVDAGNATWSGAALSFPRVQGADCCGEIIAVGAGVDAARIGERVLVRPMHPSCEHAATYAFITFGSERDGGYAQYTTAPAREAFAIQSDLTNAQLASFPCAYSTAEGMLEKAVVDANDRVLITGASGGVGSAAVQLAKRRGAYVIAICGAEKKAQVEALGADEVIARDAPLAQALDSESVSVVVDLVAGGQWPQLLDVLQRGGRYVASGAIAGPIVELDVRTLYLKDLSLFGSTWQPRQVFANLIRYIEAGEIKPQVAARFDLADIQQAQAVFLEKKYVGKLVLTP